MMLGVAAASLMGAALVWSFVLAPELRAAARAEPRPDLADDRQGAARPSEVVMRAPATYALMTKEDLPPPRRLIGSASGSGADQPRPVKQPGRPRGLRSTAISPAQAAQRADLFFAGTANPPSSSRPSSPQTDEAAAPVANPIHVVQAGAILPAALLTAVDTSRPGPVVALVTAGVYDSSTGRQLLVPQGARLIGRHEGASRYGDRRAFLVWDRLMLPNGASLDLGGAAGVDAQGALGVSGHADRRIGSLSLATLFAGAITALGQAARDGEPSGGLLGDAGDAAAIQAAQVGGRLVDRELQVTPSVRLEPGTPVRVLLTRDLAVEAFGA
jgi:type IV secretory pathway VirB10-like protein